MKKAIVFAGGGSKGAYQIGAWKAFNELNETFDIATGTSIGSINAAFYVQHDFNAAFGMWSELKADSIMTNGINLEKSFEAVFSQREHLVPFVKTYINSKGADVSPFHDKLKSYYDPEKFFSSDIDYALITVEFPSMEPVTVKKSDITDRENAWKWFAASAACFPVFPVMEIEGKNYIDGGYYDNIPVAAAFELGADEVVVVDLKTENNHEGYIKHPRVRYIRPSRELGTFLNFERGVLDRSIKLGFNDTMKVYGKYYGNVFTFKPSMPQEHYEKIASLFITLLTKTEAACDFSDTVRFQRINKVPGCTTMLADRCYYGNADELHMFFAALEMYLSFIQADDSVDYELDELLTELKSDVDGLFPMLELGIREAFDTIRKFISEKKEKRSREKELKKLEDIRYGIIIMSVIRTLQQIKYDGTVSEQALSVTVTDPNILPAQSFFADIFSVENNISADTETADIDD